MPALLREYGALVYDAMQRYLPPAEPRRYLYDVVADYPRRGGRRLRPGLCIATARAFGATLDEVLPTAVSIELLHNALLVHDDVEDESELRRGRPTLHQEHGVPLAINAGDMLAFLSLEPLLENPERLGARIARRVLDETRRVARESAEGQALDLGWRRDNVLDVGLEDYLRMVLQKTCWLTTLYPLRAGAIIGSRGGFDPDRLLAFGFFVGAAFQIQDDLLNLVGDPVRYGKELDGDLREGKRTLMLIRLLERASPGEREQVVRILSSDRAERGDDAVRWIGKLMRQYDCIGYARRVAHGLAGAAVHEAGRVFGGLPDGPDRRFLEELPAWVLARA
ncbi:MAG: polyprenyl synthetase family protein [Myxococcota bacterium]|nr:polyprenyl synthetase family protein [Myxococcota bacterium]